VRLLRRTPRVARAGWVRVRAYWAIARVEFAPESTAAVAIPLVALAVWGFHTGAGATAKAALGRA